MKGRKQKTFNHGYLQEDRAELEGIAGVQTFMWMTETEYTEGSVKINLLEQIVSPQNLNRAYRQVVSNQGSSGIDKMGVSELKSYLIANKEVLIKNILAGKYRPHPVRRVSIPKAEGKQRDLGIPTVIDRFIQQAIHQVLSPLYERQFLTNSYGFRPHRSAHDALKQVQFYGNEGYIYAVDIDLEQYFDTVNRSKLVEILSRTIQDGRVISLRGHKFVRYAEDMLILCKSVRSAERTLNNTVSFIEKKLHLRVNRTKTTVSPLSCVKFLGYGFYCKEGKWRFRVHPKSFSKMKARVREITSRSNGMGDEKRKETLKSYIRGWVNYFRMADMKSHLEKIDAWYRRRLRMVIWKRWKLGRTRFANLQRLGIPRQKAWEHANTRKSYWHTANSWILSVSITNERLKRAGYLFFSDYYKTVAPLH